MGAEQGRTRLRLVLSALVCALLLGAIGVASYGRLFSRSAESEEVSPIARLVEEAPELDCSRFEAVDDYTDLVEDPPTWRTASEAARSLERAPGETARWAHPGSGLAIATVTDADGRVVRTASMLRMLPLQGWTLKDVRQCAGPGSRAEVPN